MHIPMLIELDTTWKDISPILLSEFSDDDNIDIILEVYKSLAFELIIDRTGELVINETYNTKGIRFDNHLNKVSVIVKLSYKYYARAIKTTADLRAILSAQQNSVAMIDAAGRGNTLGVFGEQLATDIKNDILTQFSYGKSDRDLKNESIVGSGSVTIQNDNLLTAATGTDIDGSASIESHADIRYRPGHTIIAQFTALFTNPTAKNVLQYIGNIDGVNGFAIGFKDGEFVLIRINGGESFYTYKSEFNGDTSIDNINFERLNIFRITLGYLGTAPIIFETLPAGETRNRVIHAMTLQGTLLGTHIQIPYLPIRMSVTNEGNDTDCQIRTASWQGGVLGIYAGIDRKFTFPHTNGSLVKLNIGTTLTPLAAIRSKQTLNGISNKIVSIIDRISSIAFDGEGLVTIQIIEDPTITGTEGVDYNFVDIDADNSITEVSTDLTAFTGGRPLLTMYSYPTSSGSKISPSTEEIDGEKLGLFLYAHHQYIIAAQISLGTIDIGWSINWRELF